MSSIAAVAAQQQAAASSGTKTTTSATDAASLSGNLNTFLNLLMTQLQNQDPTSPLDTSQFTSQLVQYSSVEQQIKTNSSLTNLIQLTQGSEVVQSAGLLDKQVQVASDHLSLQNGAAEVKFTTNAAGTAAITVSDATGAQILAGTVPTQAGSNTWTWDGTGGDGTKVADGSYKVTVTQDNADGTGTALDTSVVGTATGVTANGGAVTVDLGALSVDFSKLQSVTPPLP